MLADAGEHVLQRPPFGPVIEHVIGGKERHADTAGKPRQEREAAAIAGAMQAVRHQADAAGKGLLQRHERRFQRSVRSLSRHDAEDHARSPFEEIGKIEVAVALLGAAVAERKQAAEPAIGGAIGRPGEDVGRPQRSRLRYEREISPRSRPRLRGRLVAEDEPAADGIAEPCLFRRDMPAHDAGKRVAVGHRDAGQPEPHRLAREFLGMRSAAQEGEVGGDGEFGEAGHGRAVRAGALEKRANRNDNMLWITSMSGILKRR